MQVFGRILDRANNFKLSLGAAAATKIGGGVQKDEERTAVLSVDGLRKSYGPILALDGVTLEVRAGEFVALLGPNGAGKSTLLQLLTGLFAPDAGTIRILGQDIRTHLTRGLALLGVVFQQPTLDLELTVEANLRYHADLHGLPRIQARKRIEELLQRFDLVDRRHDRARTLSGGNRRRVELARSLRRHARGRDLPSGVHGQRSPGGGQPDAAGRWRLRAEVPPRQLAASTAHQRQGSPPIGGLPFSLLRSFFLTPR